MTGHGRKSKTGCDRQLTDESAGVASHEIGAALAAARIWESEVELVRVRMEHVQASFATYRHIKTGSSL